MALIRPPDQTVRRSAWQHVKMEPVDRPAYRLTLPEAKRSTKPADAKTPCPGQGVRCSQAGITSWPVQQALRLPEQVLLPDP